MNRQVTVIVAIKERDIEALIDWLKPWNLHPEGHSPIRVTQAALREMNVTVERVDLGALLEWLRRWNARADGKVSPIAFTVSDH